MSRVANVILTAALEVEDTSVAAINAYLRSRYGTHVELKNVREHAGGGKKMECDVFLVAINNLDMPELLVEFHGMGWEWPEQVQLMIKGQEEEFFSIHTPITPTSPVDCNSNHDGD